MSDKKKKGQAKYNDTFQDFQNMMSQEVPSGDLVFGVHPVVPSYCMGGKRGNRLSDFVNDKSKDITLSISTVAKFIHHFSD